MWGVLSAAWANNAEVTLGRLPTVLSLYALYLGTVCFRPTRKEFFWVCALSVLGAVIAAAVGYVFGFEAGTARGRVAIGDFDSNPNALGRILVPPLALALALLVSSRGAVAKAVALGCVSVIGMGIYITMSRAALLSMMVVIAVLMYRIHVRRQILLAAAALAALLAVIPRKVLSRAEELFTGEDPTGAGRTEIWSMAVDAFQDVWLLGAGLHNFSTLSGGVAAHNSFLGVAAELGIIGLALILCAIASQFLALQRERRRGAGGLALAAVEAAALGMLTGAMFADRTWSKTFWFVWTLMTWAIYAAETRYNSAPAVAPVSVQEDVSRPAV